MKTLVSDIDKFYPTTSPRTDVENLRRWLLNSNFAPPRYTPGSRSGEIYFRPITASVSDLSASCSCSPMASKFLRVFDVFCTWVLHGVSVLDCHPDTGLYRRWTPKGQGHTYRSNSCSIDKVTEQDS